LGRRICVRVSQQDVEEDDLGEDIAQIKTGIWCDESWELIFPVGWALQNEWKLVSCFNGNWQVNNEIIKKTISCLNMNISKII
jgi:hypothetical protein